MLWGSLAGNLFQLQFYVLIFFNALRTPFFRTTRELAPFTFFSLAAKCQTKIYLFVSLFLQKIRRRVLASYKLKLEICLIILEVFLIFAPAFHDTQAAFEKCSTKIVFQQNDVVKHSSSALVVKSRKALHANLIKAELHCKYFSNNLTTSSEQHY